MRNDPEARERLLREAKAASKLNHKNILTIYAVESIDDHDFIAMEYIEGETLQDVDKKGPLKLADAVRIASMVAEALKAAHAKEIRNNFV